MTVGLIDHIPMELCRRTEWISLEILLTLLILLIISNMLLYHLYFPNANELKLLVYKSFYVICDPPKCTYI